ncbi:hypothetical protein IU479_24855 [Nocardia abscessus]|uniref:hypothetical protein n=1 Tax=Nocardia TaxID=1817 RepID=UPI001894B557|nr:MULTISPECIES: hypothetical protein [Nocardia]MBF6221336.1 hypothetical protein [Nocardia abscessus]MDE1671414.1 hypothetical protein [Nocardia gipuzkoensis]
MAVVHPPRSATIDIAGSAWPVYKLDALFVGLAAFLVLALITGSLQIAVLVAAALGAARWLIGLASVRRDEPGQRHS